MRRVARVTGSSAGVIGVVLAVVVGLQTGAAAAVQAPIVDTGGLGANVRAAPTTASAVLTTVAEGASVTVECQAFGETIRGTDVWDFLPAYGGYVSDAFVLTGYDGRSPSLPECGSSAPPPGGQLRDRIVSVAWAEVGNGHDPKYGGDPSWEWCSVFATWVWRQAGVDIPNYPFTGDVFGWGQARGLAVWGSAGVRPGDVVLYGTGPSTPSTSTHIGVVVEVQGDGRLVTVEGNFNDAVSRVGPRWPSEDWGYGPVYGYVRPSP